MEKYSLRQCRCVCQNAVLDRIGSIQHRLSWRTRTKINVSQPKNLKWKLGVCNMDYCVENWAQKNNVWDCWAAAMITESACTTNACARRGKGVCKETKHEAPQRDWFLFVNARPATSTRDSSSSDNVFAFLTGSFPIHSSNYAALILCLRRVPIVRVPKSVPARKKIVWMFLS